MDIFAGCSYTISDRVHRLVRNTSFEHPFSNVCQIKKFIFNDVLLTFPSSSHLPKTDLRNCVLSFFKLTALFRFITTTLHYLFDNRLRYTVSPQRFTRNLWHIHMWFSNLYNTQPPAGAISSIQLNLHFLVTPWPASSTWFSSKWFVLALLTLPAWENSSLSPVTAIHDLYPNKMVPVFFVAFHRVLRTCDTIVEPWRKPLSTNLRRPPFHFSWHYSSIQIFTFVFDLPDKTNHQRNITTSASKASRSRAPQETSLRQRILSFRTSSVLST